MKNKIDNLIVKFKEFYKTTYGMLITMCWALLLICLIIKLFGGNWFELWWENDNFISFCNYVETKTWLKMVIACLIYLGSGYFIICCLLNEKKLTKKQLLIFIPLMVFKSLINWYVYIISFILDMVILILIPLILTKNWKRVLVANFLIIAFQLITLCFRNVNFGFQFNVGNTFVEQTLYQIDYYIMILLFYLYTFKRKEKN